MASCIWCQGELLLQPAVTTTDRLQRVPGTFALYPCGRCGSVVLHSPPVEAQAKAMYEGVYAFERVPPSAGFNGWAGWNWLEWVAFYRRGYVRDARRIRQVLGPQPLRLLDVGCGSGLRLKVFREEGMAAEGIEVSERLWQYAAGQLGLPVRRVGLDELERSGERFDVVTLYSVLEHIPQPRSFLRAALRLVRSGGLLVLRLPVGDALTMRLLRGRHVHYREVPRHTWIPSVTALEQGLREDGAELVRREPIDLLASAGCLALSLYPASSTSMASSGTPGRYVWRRALGGMVTIAALPLACCERLTGISSEMDFFFRWTAPP